MPLGSSHRESGILLREGRWLILQRDDGGRWRLDADHGAERHLGHRVEIHGIRTDFDLLDVTSIKPC